MPAADRWDRIQELFLAAADLRAEERVQFLDSACFNDPTLRQEVESLLPYDSTSGAFISGLVGDTAESLVTDKIIGSRLGVWRIEREIGDGGMGTVYLATRDDSQFHQQVAIKLVKKGMDTEDLLNRFRHERQILANLEHPYIARLIDGGSYTDGRPFLVMEYVQGQRIDDYCDEKQLTVDQRLELFLKVCEAVSHAHRNLVVHRDLKPSNILITPDGLPKLLDFGVAKILNPDRDPSVTDTIDQGYMLTPNYASPEQIRGRKVNTASDIYSLGAILYQLISGSKAHRLNSLGREEMERVICDKEVTRPSHAGSVIDVKLRKRLTGDLDNIVLMAMRIEPSRRYPSMQHFAEDIRRHLDHRPVIAGGDSLQYHLSRFVQRHKMGILAAALVLISLITALFATIIGARRAEAQRASAEQRLVQMVTLANRSLSDVYTLIEHLPGATQTRQQFITTTLGFLEQLSKEAGHDERLRKVLGRAYLRLGDLQGFQNAPNLGNLQAALDNYQAALKLIDPVIQAHPQDTEARLLWLDLQINTASAYADRGRNEDVQRILDSVLPVSKELCGEKLDWLEACKLQGKILNRLSRILAHSNAVLATDYGKQHLGLTQALEAKYSDRADILYDQSIALVQLGSITGDMGDVQSRLRHNLAAVKLREQLVKTHPNDVFYKRALMLGYSHIGAALGSDNVDNLGKFVESREYYSRAVRMAEELSVSDPRDQTARHELGIELLYASTVPPAPGTIGESLATLRRSEGILEALSKEDPYTVQYMRDLAELHLFIGHRLRDLKRFHEAVEEYRRSIANSDRLHAVLPNDRSGHLQHLKASRGLAITLALAGNRSEAIETANEAMERSEKWIRIGKDRATLTRYAAETYLAVAEMRQILGTNLDRQEARNAAEKALSLLNGLGDRPEKLVLDRLKAKAAAMR